MSSFPLPTDFTRATEEFSKTADFCCSWRKLTRCEKISKLDMKLELIFAVAIVNLMVITSVISYNDDRPIYKWSPLVFRGFKKNSYKFCAPEYTDCRVNGYGFLIRRPCCKGLFCEQLGTRRLCMKRWRWRNTNDVYFS
ncbi:uncharacterized protein LOC143235852 [Tachypleus tridentatus]|uniref:uncharacterized protein LOC143235852 n=1 Tax=Tachypleus tridentatus TaxID=6853 RepID=UPI003FD12C14